MHEQEYDLELTSPDWCHPDYRREFPQRKTNKRIEMRLKRGEKLEDMIWSCPTLPLFYVKKGPIDYLEKIWRSKKRVINGTLAI